VRRFRTASLWMPKKNGKSPLLAAIGLYLLAGDGEPGQKVYTAAKNGDQAKIAQRHAYAMVEQSAALADDCKLNATTLQITHVPTRSMMIILTGDDSRGAKAKEGLNGSILIDECHVFDREMHERTSRAGISRTEPLNLAVSTAGDDPSSYGYERCQYGRQVNAGERDDPHFLHVEYCAESQPGERLTDADIEERLDELGQRANPAWGTIVKRDEFRADWQSSKGQPHEVARFKQYRLNLWIGSTNQWLDTAGWERGARPFKLADLRGRPCVLGLDLSRTRDMTAVSLCSRGTRTGPNTCACGRCSGSRRRPPEPRPPVPVPHMDGGRAPDPYPGDVVDYARVESDIRDAISAHQLRVCGLYFDQWNAEEITQRLAERLGAIGRRFGKGTTPCPGREGVRAAADRGPRSAPGQRGDELADRALRGKARLEPQHHAGEARPQERQEYRRGGRDPERAGRDSRRSGVHGGRTDHPFL
jgi:hypothetical protein